jgi:hypothetical protein
MIFDVNNDALYMSGAGENESRKSNGRRSKLENALTRHFDLERKLT